MPPTLIPWILQLCSAQESAPRTYPLRAVPELVSPCLAPQHRGSGAVRLRFSSPPSRPNNCHGSRCRGRGPEGDLYSKQCMLTSPKAFNGGHYSHPENRCILIPSELFVWLCFCFSNTQDTFNKTREPCKGDSALHFPLKLLEVHFQSRAVFLESMHINQNQ